MSGGAGKFNPELETKRISAFIKRTVNGAVARGIAVGVSGGVDSAVVGELCVRALGKDRVWAVFLPSKYTPLSDQADASSLAETWGCNTLKVDITPISDSLTSSTNLRGGRIPRANVQARIRMTALYYVANSEGLLVAGTGDRSEELLGFFTKFGDGGADFLPIAHLYKTQVRALGRHLGLPRSIVEKPASPRLWHAHTAREELPADYDKLDRALACLFDEKMPPDKAALKAGVSKSLVDRVLKMHQGSEHKRTLPPSLI